MNGEDNSGEWYTIMVNFMGAQLDTGRTELRQSCVSRPWRCFLEKGMGGPVIMFRRCSLVNPW